MYYGYDMNDEMKAMVVSKIKAYYMVLRIFGTYIFAMMCLALVAFVYNMISGDTGWEDSSGEVNIMGYFTQGFCLLIIGAMVFGAYKLMMLGIKPGKRIENGDFFWYMGYVTEKHSYQRKGSKYIFINNERCISINSKDYSLAAVGDEYLVVCLAYSQTNVLKFAMKPY